MLSAVDVEMVIESESPLRPLRPLRPHYDICIKKCAYVIRYSAIQQRVILTGYSRLVTG
jgi:hypothetical protein